MEQHSYLRPHDQKELLIGAFFKLLNLCPAIPRGKSQVPFESPVSHLKEGVGKTVDLPHRSFRSVPLDYDGKTGKSA